MKQRDAPEAVSQGEEDLRRRVINGIIIAALLVVGVLGSVMMFSEVYTPDQPGKGRAAKSLREAADVAKPEPGETTKADSVAAPGGIQKYALKLGTFSNVASAEDVRATLERQGIPATVSIEVRVTVGPFSSRQDADAARARLQELGLDGGSPVTIK
jgi:cell division septation protein DedD